MKRRRFQSLLLAAVMIASMVTNAVPVYAEPVAQDTGHCMHHLQHTADCGYREADEGAPCQHVCTEESGCVVVNCVHQHDETCGYHEEDPDSCTHVCTAESGCVVTSCIHEHDDGCGYRAPTAEAPCGFVCPICDCVCTDLCTEGKVNADCPVCSRNWQDCSFTQVQLALSFEVGGMPVDYAQENATLVLRAQITGNKVEKVRLQVQLTEQEAGMLSGGTGVSIDENHVLTAELSSENPRIEIAVNKNGNGAVRIDLSKEDIAVFLTPEEFQTSPAVAVSVAGDSVTLVDQLPAAGEYGSGIQYDAQVDDVTVRYVDAKGKSVPRQEAAPDFTLWYQVGQDEPLVLDAETLPFGMTAVPKITTVAASDSWTGSVEDAGTLPSTVLTGDAAGGYLEQPVSWYLVPSYPEDYYANAGSLVKITDENASSYPSTLGRGWYFISGQEPYPDDAASISEYLDVLEHDVYWADNGNAASRRPQSLDGYYELQYAFDGSSSYTTLTESVLDSIGLEAMPQPTVKKQSGIWQFSWEDVLPSEVSYTDSTGGGGVLTRELNWRVVFKNTLSSYAMVEVNEENDDQYSSVQGQYGTYYMQETSLKFTARIYRGKTSQGDSLREAFLEQFSLDAEYTGARHLYFPLIGVLEDGHIIEDVGEDPDQISITVTNLWRYNLDNTRINYSVEENKDGADGRLDGVETLDEGDYFAISYDNSAVPSFSDVTDSVYSGGTLKLTLTGTVNYNATKVWLDDGKTVRPEATMELWRYRSGESYTTASLVRDSNGAPYTLSLDHVEPNADGSYSITFLDDLPKYDPEGYRYLYVVREYLSGENADRYEQVFGSVAADGTVQDTLPEYAPRAANDTFLYNGGALSNRLRGTVPVSVTKDWKAASFQSEFEDVMVQLRLQSRYKDSNTEWEDTEYTCDLFGFLAENLTVTHTGSYPRYDDQGKEIEYRWVEESVYQGGRVEDGNYVGGTRVPFVENADGTRDFVLEQNGREILYRSSCNQGETENCTIITNSIANVISYDMEKKFEPEWNEQQYAESYTFSLFRTTSGAQPILYAAFTVDRDVENAPPTITKHVNDNAVLSIEQSGEWKVHISGLPEFDGDGQRYEYLLLEQGGSPLQMTVERDDEGNYTGVVSNGPGEGNLILVRKEWIDESDTQHRLPVTVTVYEKDTNRKIAETTLGPDSWYDIVGIGDREWEDVYLLETAVGDQKLPGEITRPVYVNDPQGKQPTAVRFSTQYHDYEATYSYDPDFGSDGGFGGICCFTVTNRRLGNINLTVTKNWVDGEGEKREALQNALDEAGLKMAVRLDFMTAASLGLEQIYTISRDGFGDDETGDIVTISQGNPTKIKDDAGGWVDSIQILDLTKSNQTIYFWSLPKYDGNGASVRYDVSEVFVQSDGSVVSEEELAARYSDVAEAYRDYQLSTVEGEYKVGQNHALDTQEFTLTNKLSATADISWYTRWLDDFAYESNNRPDIYLNIYARTHEKDSEGNVVTKTTLFVRNYRWEYEEIPGDIGVTEENFWKCTIEGLPKYDDLGYEIDYFAVMNSTVKTSDFDYLDTAYAPERAIDDTSIFGTAAGLIGADGEDHQHRVQQVSEDAQNPVFALQSGNTFINTIYDTITYSGEKLWTNLPDDYPLVDLPTVTFILDRSIPGGELEKNIASMTIEGDDWQNLNSNGHYEFEFAHTGANVPAISASDLPLPEGESWLPRFDGNGRLYTYVLREEIDWEGTDAGDAGTNVFDISSAGRTIANSYSPDTASLSAIKYLTVPKGRADAVYPAITMNLTRSYTTNAGEASEEELVAIKTWSAKDVKAAVDGAVAGADGMVTVNYQFEFLDLPIYAPNGSRYQYTITEDKDQLGGYLTWADRGDVTPADLEDEGNKNRVSVTGLVANLDDGIDASFLNRPEEAPAPIELTGVKVWNDLGNAFGFRPDLADGLEIKLERSANAQSGQNNGIGWHQVEIDGTAVQITWTQDPNNADRWNYTITGLERYADNGMPWIYRVTETIPKYYTATGNGVVSQKPADPQTGNITMNNLSNSILTNTYFKKIWVDQDGAPITGNPLGEGIELAVEYGLQLRAKAEGGADWSEWQEAGAYFEQNLAADDGTGLQNRVYTGSIQAPLGDNAWGAAYYGEGRSFNNLPRYMSANGTVYALEYRVVETAVKVFRVEEDGTETRLLHQIYTAPTSNGGGSYAYTVSGAGSELFVPYYNGAAGQANGTKEHKNRLITTELTVGKEWVGDNNKVYRTRPTTTASRYSWQVTLLVERSADGVHWDPIPQDAQITLYGTDDQNRVTQTIDGLPAYFFDAEGRLVACRYRVRELQATGTDAGKPLNAGAEFAGGYTVEYSTDGLIAINTLATTELRAIKDWNEPGETHPAVTLELRYLKEGGDPDNSTHYLPFTPAAKVRLDGSADSGTNALYYAEDDWTAVWKEVPLVLANSERDENGATIYKIFETAPSGYLVEQSTKGNTTTITNTPSVTPRVAKYWLGIDPAQKVAVELRRGLAGDTQGQLVTTVELTAAGGWTHTLAAQPMYDPDGNPYTYWVVETKVGDQTAAEAAAAGGFDISYGGSATAGFSIYNRELDTIAVIKDWADAGDPDARPTDLELTLQRTTKANPTERDWETLTDVTYTWERVGAQWTTSFTGLPMYENETRQPYTYRVLETVPEGYTQTVISDDDLTFHFRNTRTEEIDIPVRKVWVDNDNNLGDRPDSVTVELYQNGQPTGRTLTLGPNPLQSLFNGITGANTGWSGVFTDLPKYDADGALFVYTIVERDPSAHYTVDYSTEEDGTLVVTNTALGALTISKKVTGSGDPEQIFHFTLKLSDDSVSGQHGDLVFYDGIAEFQLSDGQQVTARDLPVGVQYTVIEQEADQGPYTTQSSGETGGIEVGVIAQAAFVNDWSKTTVKVEKRWQDEDNRDGIRPDSITVLLLADGSETGKFLTLTADNGWKGSFTELDVYADGKPIVYTIKEVEINGYTTQISGSAAEGFVVTNSHTPERTDPPKTPQTGDNSHLPGWFALGSAAVLGLLGCVLLRRRKKAE